MKRSIKTAALTIGLLVGFLGTDSLLAQEGTADSLQVKTQTQTRNRNQVKTQNKYEVKEATQTQTRRQEKAQNQNQVEEATQTQTQTKTQTQAKVQNQHNRAFVDENGDGFNDLAPDHDGDGIPNGQDPDYTGPKTRAGNENAGFVDLDGDGINDNAATNQKMKRMRKGGNGPADGTGNGGVGPQDGTGNGAGNGTGDCDGTGPKGKRGGKK